MQAFTRQTRADAPGLGVPGAARERSGCTVRSFLVGTIFAAALSMGAPYGNMVLRGSYMAQDFSTPGALFLFFILVAVLNVLLKLIHPRLALRRAELLIVYIMMLIASAITTCGMSEYLLPVITSWHYYATPENAWAEQIHPYIKEWIVPHDPLAIRYFYEGAPKGVGIPWEVWTRPLLLWITMVLVLYFVMVCVAVIVRRQWMDRERLIYPLVQVPLEMIREDGSRSPLPAFFRNPVMWAGFLIPFLISTVNALHNYYHFIPEIRLAHFIPIFRRTDTLRITLSFPVLGFSYLIHLDVAFSLWFFNLLVTLQKGIYNIFGFVSTETLGRFTVTPPNVAHQEMGAMIVLVLFGLWIGRSHFRDVLRKACPRAREGKEADEILSYRTAFWGMLAGLTFIGFWLSASGIPERIVPAMLVGSFLIFVGLTRIVAESGVAEARTPMTAQAFVTSGVGTSALGPGGLTALGFTFIWATELRILVLSSAAHGLKLIEDIRGNRRPVFWAMILATVVSIASSVWAILKLSYTYGGINLNEWFFGAGARAPFQDFVALMINNPKGPSWEGWFSTGVGAMVMGLLMFLRQRFLWWPLHPVGFPIAGLWLMNHSWFSIFLAWLSKSVILKYGGPRWFRALRPFFLGMILGQFASAGIWLIIDQITGMTDNRIFSW